MLIMGQTPQDTFGNRRTAVGLVVHPAAPVNRRVSAERAVGNCRAAAPVVHPAAAVIQPSFIGISCCDCEAIERNSIRSRSA